MKPSLKPQDDDIEEIDFGFDNKRKFIKLSKSLSFEQKERYQSLFNENIDAFAWS